MTISALKLVTGEELVVEIASETDNYVEFKNPVACVMQRSEKGPVLGFMPWMQAGDGPFVVNKDKIVTTCEVAQEVKNGIVVPPKGLITG